MTYQTKAQLRTALGNPDGKTISGAKFDLVFDNLVHIDDQPYINLNAEPFNAITNGITDNTAVFDSAQVVGDLLGFPVTAVGTVLLSGANHVPTGHKLFNMIASFKGRGAKASRLLYVNVTGDNRGITICPPNTIHRIERLGITATDPVNQPRDEVDEQAQGLNFVTLKTPANASKYPVGRYVKFGFNKNFRDADDAMFLYYKIHKVKANDPGTGKVTFHDNINQQVSGGGYDGTVHATYAPGQTISVGNRRYDATDQLYEALTAGTTEGATIQDDFDNPVSGLGVDWKKLTNTIGGLDKAMENYMPMIQLMLDDVPDGVIISDCTIEVQSQCVYPISVRNCINSGFRNVTIKGQVGHTLNCAEAATNPIFENIIDETTIHGAPFEDSFSRNFSCYSVNDFRVINYQGSKGKGNFSRGAFLEAGSSGIFENVIFHTDNPDAAEAYGIMMAGGVAGLRNVTFNNHKVPLRGADPEASFLPRYLDPRPKMALYKYVEGCSFYGISSKTGFRGTGDDPRNCFKLNNFFRIKDTLQSGTINHPLVVDFVPYKLSEYKVTLNAQVSARGTWVEYPKINEKKNRHFVVLAMDAVFTGAQADTIAKVRIRCPEATNRFFFASASTDNDLAVSQAMPWNEITDGPNGTKDRYFRPSTETMQYMLSAFTDDAGTVDAGTDGGTIEITVYALEATI